MKVMIIRHGDPDYEKDSLTPAGWKEAEALAERLCKLDIKAFYTSPLGRAKDTASCTLKKMNRTAGTKDWLREFPATVERGSVGSQNGCAWDWLPQEWTREERFYDLDTWTEVEAMKDGDVGDLYDHVCQEFDQLLSEHGYEREEKYYRVTKGNNDTIAIFCHFGLECVLLSHLLNIPVMTLWHGFCAPPSSVTVVRTEERREGIASFRVSNFGDTSHLYASGLDEAFAARFCECYENEDERHD